MITLHIVCALLSIIGFSYRGYLKIFSPGKLQARWLKIAPHVIDTLLLASAIYLVISHQLYPEWFNWLSAKLVALFVYIGLGIMTLRFAKSRPVIIISFLLALTTFAYIVTVARTKQAWPLML